jgi:hypothetical protein
MSEHGSNRDAMGDAEVETLLVDFFQREMPSGLGEFSGSAMRTNRKPSRVEPSAERPTTPVAQPGRAAGVGVVAVAVCLGVALMAVFSPGPKDQIVNDGELKKADRDATESLVVEAVEEPREPAKPATFETTDGPVELRNERPITNVRLFHSKSGTNADVEFPGIEEVEFPGIEIEIIPIDDDE